MCLGNDLNVVCHISVMLGLRASLHKYIVLRLVFHIQQTKQTFIMFKCKQEAARPIMSYLFTFFENFIRRSIGDFLLDGFKAELI